MKSFEVIVFAGCFTLTSIMLGIFWIVPINSQTIFEEIGILVVLVAYAFILKRIENARDKWDNKK